MDSIAFSEYVNRRLAAVSTRLSPTSSKGPTRPPPPTPRVHVERFSPTSREPSVTAACGSPSMRRDSSID